MAQTFNTTIGLSANAASAGQAVDFDAAYVSGLVITNGSGISIQYAADGSTWATLENGATVTAAVVSPSAFRLRKSTSDSYPVPVRLSWIASSVAPATLSNRTQPVRVATFGDSTANVTVSGIAQQDVTAYNPSFPASGATVIGVSIDKFALPTLYPQAYLVGNCGISGDTTTQMLARDQAAAGVNRRATADVANLRPDVVLFRGGSINDILSVTAGTLSATVSAVYSRHVQLIGRLLAAGAVVIDEGIYGFANGTSNTATDLASTLSAITQLNALFAAYAATLPGRVYFLDTTGLLSDSTGAYVSGVSTDGTHLNQWGAYVLASAERDLLNVIFGRANGSRFAGANCVVNAMMANTATVAHGTVAAGYIAGATNATRQNAKVEVIDGRVWQTCEFVGTGAGSPMGNIFMPYDPTSTSTVSPMNIVAGDVYGFEFDFYLAGLNGAAPPAPTQILGRLETYKNGAGRIVWDNLSPAVYSALGGAYTGKCVIGPWAITEPSANLTTSSGWYFQFTTAETTASFKLGVSNPRIVKLGTALTLT